MGDPKSSSRIFSKIDQMFSMRLKNQNQLLDVKASSAMQEIFRKLPESCNEWITPWLEMLLVFLCFLYISHNKDSRI